jgi:hypothetical protein
LLDFIAHASSPNPDQRQALEQLKHNFVQSYGVLMMPLLSEASSS